VCLLKTYIRADHFLSSWQSAWASLLQYILCTCEYSIVPIVSHANDKFAIKPLNIRFKNPPNTFLTIKSLLSCSRIYCTRGDGFYCSILRFSLKFVGLLVISTFQLVPVAVILNIPIVIGAGASSFLYISVKTERLLQSLNTSNICYWEMLLSSVGTANSVLYSVSALALHTRLWWVGVGTV
jgi:hypothetical protein